MHRVDEMICNHPPSTGSPRDSEKEADQLLAWVRARLAQGRDPN